MIVLVKDLKQEQKKFVVHIQELLIQVVLNLIKKKKCRTTHTWADERKYVCSWKKRDEHTRQNHCCLLIKKCCEKKCKTKIQKCHWKGKKVSIDFKKGCFWDKKGKHSQQKKMLFNKKNLS